MGNYATVVSHPLWRRRWWLRGRIRLVDNPGEAEVEFFVPRWAKPLDWLHGLIWPASHRLNGQA
jgi:hypothetical protein